MQDLNLRMIIKPWQISNTQSLKYVYQMCAINVLYFLDYWFYKSVEYGFRKGQLIVFTEIYANWEEGRIGEVGLAPLPK